MVTFQAYERKRFDQKRLELERPDIAREYVSKLVYRTLHVKAPKRRAQSA